MNTSRNLLATALLLVSAASLHAQGALAPPGPPAPTMKTLAQIEPRRPVDLVNTPGDANNTFIITEPGSYYLTSDVVSVGGRSGIRVDVGIARGVTIDLNGFSVIGQGQDAGNGSTGIVSNSQATPVTVFGGHVTGWPGHGLFMGGPARLHDLHIADCGGAGIEVNGGSFSFPDESRVSAIERCEVRNVRHHGILASGARVSDCVVARVRPVGGTGVGGILAGQVNNSRVTNIVSTNTIFSWGILADIVADCVVMDVAGAGQTAHISAQTVTGCRVGREIAALATSGPDYGIDARHVDQSHVFKLQGNATGVVHGIRASHVQNSVVERVANAGTGAVSGIIAAFLAFSGDGSSTTPALHAEGNTVSGITGVGISGNNGHSRIVGNVVRGCTGDAIAGAASGIITDNSVNIPTGASSDGIDVSNCQVSDNMVRNFGSGVGVRTTSGGMAVRNTVAGGTGFSFAASTRTGPIVSGGGSAAFDPNANLDL